MIVMLLGLQLKQIEAQNKLANAETVKTLAEANKISGVDTEGAKLDNEWKKIENRIQISRENIEASNVTAAEANAQKAVAEWNSAVIQAEIDAETKAEKTQIIIEQLTNMRKEEWEADVQKQLCWTKGKRNDKSLKKQAQSKQEIKEFYGASPDLADGFVLQFSRKIHDRLPENQSDIDGYFPETGSRAIVMPETVPDYEMDYDVNY